MWSAKKNSSQVWWPSESSAWCSWGSILIAYIHKLSQPNVRNQKKSAREQEATQILSLPSAAVFHRCRVNFEPNSQSRQVDLGISSTSYSKWLIIAAYGRLPKPIETQDISQVLTVKQKKKGKEPDAQAHQATSITIKLDTHSICFALCPKKIHLFVFSKTSLLFHPKMMHPFPIFRKEICVYVFWFFLKNVSFCFKN